MKVALKDLVNDPTKKIVEKTANSTMRSVLFLFCSFCLLMGGPSYAGNASKSNGVVYGREIPESGNAIPLNAAVKNIPDSGNKLIKISGTVNKVCRRRGCWMILSEGEYHARVTFKDYKFFVPTDTYNQRSVVYGVLSEHTLSEKMAKHYADDAGQNSSHISGPQKEYSIEAVAVYLENASVVLQIN